MTRSLLVRISHMRSARVVSVLGGALIASGYYAVATPPAQTSAAAQVSAKPKGFVGFRLTTEHEGGPAVVHSVFEGSPASSAGFQEGDILLQVGDVPVKDVQASLSALGAMAPGDRTIIKVNRFGKEMSFALTIAERPPEEQLAPPSSQGEFDPAVQIQDEDYAKARAQFHTKLTRKGPSPQEWSPVAPPVDVSEIEYPSGALRLKAWVSHPDDPGRKHPAVLFLHGGFAFGYPDDWDVSKPYRDAGFVVMTPLLRGENGQPGSFSFLYDEVDDALAAAEHLSKLPYVDGNRIFIAGPSAGGTVALLAAMASARFRAVASFSATPDQVVFCKHAKNAARDLPFDITDLRELQMRSPLAYAASLKCPAKLYVGTQETEFQTTTRMTAKIAHDHGRSAEALLMEGDHESSVLPGVKQSVEFFLKNGER